MHRNDGGRKSDIDGVRQLQPQSSRYVSGGKENSSSLQKLKSQNSSSDPVLNHNNYVWIRVDVVDAIWKNNGSLPDEWKPTASRKRARTDSSVAGASFDWIRALVDQSSVASTQALSYREKSAKSTHVQATFQVQDEEFAPSHLRNVKVSLSYDPGETSDPLVCDANTWWNTRDRIPPEDLTLLTHLHEPAVVYCLKERYRNDSIYTYTGKILLALNPFRSIQGFYGDAVMERYWKPNPHNKPPPHVYVIAQDAYRSMLNDMGESRNGDQSILVSGESGAGKSVTTKLIMGYLAAQSQRTSSRNSTDIDKQGIESQLLQSNPILESFGNARTVRNDNSSRFGKFIELVFTASGSLASASVETYLLEKVRIISQAPGERNYHIFYEILAGLPQRERQTLHIGNVSAKDFRMTASSGTYDRRDGVDDRETFQHLRKALDTVGFLEGEQRDMIIVSCALLHASNIEFAANSTSGGEEGSQIVNSNALQSVIDLLGVPFETLASALCVCVIEARGEVFHKNLTVSQSMKACEALIKATYGALFVYIVKKINLSIAANLNSTITIEKHSRIGVLDIFGFESFKVNSFEQLCINYCNEALQQQFNRFVFKLEQEEYEREGINWAFITFPDNQDVLDLIEKRREGILSILDDQCRVATCTDTSFCRVVHDKCKEHPRFVASLTQRSNLCFTVHHYAGHVTYDARLFLEKNKDELPKETTELLVASSRPFISDLGNLLSEKPGTNTPQRPASPTSSVSSFSSVRGTGSSVGKKPATRGSSSLHRDSVGSQFSHQLKELRRRIDSTTPHYVRCLKPNEELVPDRFDPQVIADQLRCAGVLEVIRVSRLGFPHRFLHNDFMYRYGILIASRATGKSSQTNRCSAVVEDLIPVLIAALQEHGDSSTSDDFKDLVSLGMQMGHSKVFLRREVFETLENLRNRRLGRSSILIQKVVRRFMAQIKYSQAYRSTVILQSSVRMLISKRNVSFIRQDTAAIKLQCAFRKFRAISNLNSARVVARFCQAYQRGAVARQLYAMLLEDKRALIIQKCWRRHKCESRYVFMRAAVVILQCFERQRKAQRRYKELRLEARNLSVVLIERDRFKQEMLKLKLEVERLKNTSLPGQHFTEQSDVLPKSDGHSVIGSEVEFLRAEVVRLQEALSKQNESKIAQSNVPSPEPDIIRSPPRWSLFRAKTNGSRATDPESSHSPQSTKSGFGLHSPSRTVDCQATATPLSWPTAGTSRMTSPSTSLLDSEQYNEISDDHVQITPLDVDVDSPLKNSIREDDPLPVVARRGIEFGEKLRWLHESISDHDDDRINSLIRSTTDPHVLVNEIGDFGRAALHVAVDAADVETARILIDCGAFVNAQDMAGDTPLHLSTDVHMTRLLLEHGKANPNIPNMEGICVLHSAVQRMDLDSVRLLLKHHAKVDTADNLRWFTPLHLAVLPASDNIPSADARAGIVEVLCNADTPDLNNQDLEGNTALHYAVQMETREANAVIRTLLENGASPGITNSRKQTPLLLLCHNRALRRQPDFQDCLHVMLAHGANPNEQSTTGATPLHLCLYNKDIDGAVQLVGRAAELNLSWQKPWHWESFWKDMGGPEVLPLDMITDRHSLHRVVSAIVKQPQPAPKRPWCMQCQTGLGGRAKTMHCGHCGRHTCSSCSQATLPPSYFPKSFLIDVPTPVCQICEKILGARKEDSSSSTHPLSSSIGYEDEKGLDTDWQ